MNPVLKSEQLAMGQMGQFDPSQMGQFGFQMPQFYQNQLLPNPTLAGNAALNVDLSDYPTPQELEPDAVSKVCKADVNPDKNGEQEPVVDNGEANGEDIVQKPAAATSDPVDSVNPAQQPLQQPAVDPVHAMIPKAEHNIHGEPVSYDQMLLQQQQMMVDPNAMMMQQQYEQQLMMQQMMADPNAMMQYGQQMYPSGGMNAAQMYDPNVMMQ